MSTRDDKPAGGDTRRGEPLPSAEATQYRLNQRRELDGSMPSSSDSTRRTADSYNLGGKSLRMGLKPKNGGLAAKIALPVVLSLLFALAPIIYVIGVHVANAQLASLKRNVANSTYGLGVLGRFFIVHRQSFLYDNPGYSSAEEWRSGDHWIAKDGFISEADWEAATGFRNNEYAPIDILERAAERVLLSDLKPWLDSSGVTDLAAAFILDRNGNLLASAVAPALRFDPASLRILPASGNGAPGTIPVRTDYLPDFVPEPVVRGMTTIMSHPESGEPIGTVVTIFRAGRMDKERHSFLLLQACLGLLLLGFAGVAILLVAGRATRPMRRLVADMQAMADGDYSRRSSLATVNDETGLLAQAFNSMAERLRVARANERETSRLESDLAIARSIQNNLLPPQTPRVRGLDIHTSYRPAREIGGDYFDFLPVDGQHMGMVIADASGKSIPAALVMSTTRAILRFVAPGNLSAAETLTRVNAILSVDIPRGMFVTAYYILLDPLEQSMTCASAGHNPLLIARADGSVELLNPGGIALGFDSGPIFQRSIREQKVKLATGDRILIYTDGVVECVNTANEEYSDRRLREFLRRNRELSSHDFIGALLADLDRHRGPAEIRDDTTIVTFKVL